MILKMNEEQNNVPHNVQFVPYCTCKTDKLSFKGQTECHTGMLLRLLETVERLTGSMYTTILTFASFWSTQKDLLVVMT